MSSSKLLAFQMTKPLTSIEKIEDAQYDSEAQTTIWKGQARAQADFFCTWSPYGYDCSTEPGICFNGINLYWFAYQCDGG